jgi:hypothetical protein
MLVAAFIVGAGIIIELCAVIMAPLGYQDEAGFHAGPERVSDEDTRLWGNPS